jgi:TonB-linked SusC/RagA family outer membrane protein
MKCQLLLCMILSCILCSSAFAQTKNITGVVSDEKGNTLPGATVTAKGTTTAVKTDVNGKFAIEVPVKTKSLLVTFIGMQQEEVGIGRSGSVTVTLRSLATVLQDVVVIGYGTQRRANVSSAISSVKAKDLKDLPVAGIDQAIQGKVAGVTVDNNGGQPGGGVSIKVRGITTINGNDPLIVIDGVPFYENTRQSSGYAGLGGANGQTGNSVMATLNPNDIESVDILKDASAQAIYGSRAANGVILITTKKGKSGDGKINYDVYLGQSQIYKKLDLMDLQQFAIYQNQIATTPTGEFADPSKLGRGTDWQDAMFKNGLVQNHQLSFSGGSDKTVYYLSMNYFKQEGTLIGSDFTRYTTRFNLDHQIKSWMKVGVSSNASKTIQHVALSDAAPGAIWDMAILNPLVPVKNLDGSWGGGANNFIPGVQSENIDNPVANTELRKSRVNTMSFFGNIYAEIKFLKNFSLKNEISYYYGPYDNVAYQLAGNVGTRQLSSQYSDYRSTYGQWTLRNYLNYNWYKGKHGVSATAGHEAQYNYSQSIRGKKINLANNLLDLNAGSSDQTTWELGGGKGDGALESYFARASYTYDNRYSLTASLRSDRSSNFGLNNPVGYFPGASFAWTVTNEKFAQQYKNIVNNLKLRVGYGAVGNFSIPYRAGVGFWPGPVGFGTSSYLNGILNPDLTWEKVITTNVGLDATILNGLVDFSVDVYEKSTASMIFIGTGPRLLGVGDNWDDLKGPVINTGKMTNKGVDISITSNNIKTKDLTWKTTLIFSKYTNVLDKLAGAGSAIYGKVFYDQYLLTKTVPGAPIGSFFGYVTDGLFRDQKDLTNSLPQFGYPVDQDHTWLGDVRFKDINGDGKITEADQTNIGSPLPKFTYGLTNTVNYKDFDLTVFVQGSQGAKIYNFLRWRLEKMDNTYSNQLTSVLDRYTATNTGGSLPRYKVGQVNNVAVSDRYIEDGSYLRIKNIAVGYRIPANILKRAKIANARIYVSIQNLATITKYTGMDPEIGAYNNDIRLINVDQGHYPNPRSFTAGINIEL